MNQIVKSVRHIQIKQVSYTPQLFQAIITYQPHQHPYEYDESDDIEYQKKLINKLIDDKWFVKPYDCSKDLF